MKPPFDLSKRFFAALLMTSMVALLAAGCGGGVTNIVFGMWAWMGGSSTVNSNGSYGSKGIFAVGNVPGARSAAASWRDSNGKLWLFGGYGYDGASLSPFLLNDLWEFNGSEWAWIGGSSTGGGAGVYGTLGTSYSTNLPGARQHALNWVDSSGNLWLFGGYGVDANSNQGFLSGLWRYSGGNWTWMAGSNVVNVKGVYGSLATPATGNFPGARQGAAGWVDSSGNLWLFGGYGYDSAGTLGFLNDLWRFSGGKWAWMGGSSLVNAKGSYGTLGTGAPGNIPGARYLGAYWRDSAGNFWLFGGYGSDSAGTGVTGTPGVGSALNDLWEYNFTNQVWAWMGGSTLANAKGNYGALNATTASGVPGARSDMAFCVDSLGNAWLFGGSGYDALAGNGHLNDLWKFDGTYWTWASGSNVVNAAGSYGTLGNAAASNVPGARGAATAWCSGKNPWLFGGDGLDSAGTRGALNDVWQFRP